MLQRSLIADMAEALGKSEEEVRKFFEALWQRLPLVMEVEPPFVRYLEAKIDGVRSTLEATINGLRATMEQALLRTDEKVDALRKEMEQGLLQAKERDETLRREMQERFDTLRKEMELGFQQAVERDEALRKELRTEIEALRGEIRRLERWFFAFYIPILLMLIGLVIQNIFK